MDTAPGLGQTPEYLDRSVEGAASLGAKRFALSGAGGIGTKEGQLKQEALDKKIEAIMRLAKRCQEAGLRLVYHNHGAEFTAGGAQIEALLNRTDPQLVFFLLDLGHAFREKADVVAFFTQHYQRIDALHLRDIRGKEQVPLGQGELDFVSLAAAIRKTNWPGWLTVEEENLPKSIDTQAIESVLESDRRAIHKFFGV
jgi:sugar phosphate isomerase/epimerase